MLKPFMVLFATGMVAFSTAYADSTALNTDAEKLSYSVGVDLGRNFKKQGIDVIPAVMSQGLTDAMSGKVKLTDKQMQDVLTQFQKNLVAKRMEQFKQLAADNKKKSEAFLTTNKAKAGVVTTASGLQYKVITEGKGKKPTKDDTVTVEYKGQLINGQVFDSTEKTGKPATFKLSQVIPGWTEVLQLMPEGSTWEVYIPSELAYGQRSVGGVIEPNSALIFNIHLISIDKK